MGTNLSVGLLLLLPLVFGGAGCQQEAREIEPVTFGATNRRITSNTWSSVEIHLAAAPDELIEAFEGRGCREPSPLDSIEAHPYQTIFSVSPTDGGVLLGYPQRNSAPRHLREFSARRVGPDGGRSICSDRPADQGTHRILSPGTVLTTEPLSGVAVSGEVALLVGEHEGLWVTDGDAIQPVSIPFSSPRAGGVAAHRAYLLEGATGVLWSVALDGGAAESTQMPFESVSRFTSAGSDVVFRGCVDQAPSPHCRLFRHSPGEPPVQIANRAHDEQTDPAGDCVAHRGAAFCSYGEESSAEQLGRYDPETKAFAAVTALPAPPEGVFRRVSGLTSAGDALLFATRDYASLPLDRLWVLQADGGVEQLFGREGGTSLKPVAWDGRAVITSTGPDGGAVMVYEAGTLRSLAPFDGRNVLGVWRDQLIYLEEISPPVLVRRLDLHSGESFSDDGGLPSPNAALIGDYVVAYHSPPDYFLGRYEEMEQEAFELTTGRLGFARVLERPLPQALPDGRLIYVKARGPDRGARVLGPNELADVTPPTLTCPPDVVVDTTTYRTGAVTGYAGADGGDGEGPVRLWYSQDPGFFPLGTTPVTVIAADRGGNTTQCTFEVTVR